MTPTKMEQTKAITGSACASVDKSATDTVEGKSTASSIGPAARLVRGAVATLPMVLSPANAEESVDHDNAIITAHARMDMSGLLVRAIDQLELKGMTCVHEEIHTRGSSST
mmetsp:Transcript_34526/g.78850  ORF Transcript_34526/g.78850 Transcript_34526/m.78850 type:complete len:111 (+) Transcript_34526:155-487(+)